MAAQLAAITFNHLDQYASSSSHRSYCYAELAVSSPAVVKVISSTHYTYPQRDGQAELTWSWLNTEVVCLSINGHPSQH